MLTPAQRRLVIERRRAFSVFDEAKLNSRVANMSAQTIHQAYQSLARIADDFSPFLSARLNGALTTICNIFLILRSGKRSQDIQIVDMGRHFAIAVSKLDPNREFFAVYTYCCIKQITFCLMLCGTLDFGRTTVHECYHKEILQLLSHSNHIATERKIMEYYSKNDHSGR